MTTVDERKREADRLWLRKKRAVEEGRNPLLVTAAPLPLVRIRVPYGQVPEIVNPPCARADPELFFSFIAAETEQAKAICEGCAAKSLCLQGALERAEPWGV